MIVQIADNPLCWVMLLTAWFTYQSIFSMVAQDKASSNIHTSAVCESCRRAGERVSWCTSTDGAAWDNIWVAIEFYWHDKW